MTVPPIEASSGIEEMTCQDTNATLFDFGAPGNSGWYMFHLINAGAAQELAFSIDKHDLWVVSADGAYIKPVKVQVSTKRVDDCWQRHS